MSRTSRNQNTVYINAKEVVEPEVGLEERVVKQLPGQSQNKEANLSLKKCKSVDGQIVKKKHKSIRTSPSRKLKMPQLTDKIVDIVNILKHEKFLEMVDRYFKPITNKQPRRRSQSKKLNMPENSDSKIGLSL
ncbi:hypothetical protein ANTQUA_LOCUS9788 [Anthophora quadrimaculata]